MNLNHWSCLDFFRQSLCPFLILMLLDPIDFHYMTKKTAERFFKCLLSCWVWNAKRVSKYEIDRFCWTIPLNLRKQKRNQHTVALYKSTGPCYCLGFTSITNLSLSNTLAYCIWQISLKEKLSPRPWIFSPDSHPWNDAIMVPTGAQSVM